MRAWTMGVMLLVGGCVAPTQELVESGDGDSFAGTGGDVGADSGGSPLWAGGELNETGGASSGGSFSQSGGASPSGGAQSPTGGSSSGGAATSTGGAVSSGGSLVSSEEMVLEISIPLGQSHNGFFDGNMFETSLSFGMWAYTPSQITSPISINPAWSCDVIGVLAGEFDEDLTHWTSQDDASYRVIWNLRSKNTSSFQVTETVEADLSAYEITRWEAEAITNTCDEVVGESKVDATWTRELSFRIYGEPI